MKIHASVRWFAAAILIMALFVVLAQGQHFLVPLGIILVLLCAGLCMLGGLLHLMFS